jgi:hypothetical protein
MESREFLGSSYKIQPVPLWKAKTEFFSQKKLHLISSQFASRNRRDLRVDGNNMKSWNALETYAKHSHWTEYGMQLVLQGEVDMEQGVSYSSEILRGAADSDL